MSDPMATTTRSPAVPYALLLLSGVAFLAAALLYNELVLGLLAPGGLVAATVARVRRVEAWFLVIGVALLLCAFAVARIPAVRAFASKPLVGKLMLAVLIVAVPVGMLEMALRPVWLAKRPSDTTTIFVRDAELGWRLRPGADDRWGDVRVRINAKGLRGPELPYDKPAGVFRILYLGDSVTFGYRLERDEDTFPYRTGQVLEKRTSGRIETINAGVDGYSPWQEHAYLRREGLRYQPDLVIVSFILNDVTEKFWLTRFGGGDEGFQLAHTVSRWSPAERSAIFFFARDLLARFLYGQDVKKGAARSEMLDAKDLVYNPERPGTDEAWGITLGNLGKLFDLCAERNVPAVLVSFPYTFQFEDPVRLATPQKVLGRFAAERSIPFLDLLPSLHAHMKPEGRPPTDYFLDWDHLTVLGGKVVAAELSDFLARRGLVPERAAVRDPGR